MTNAQPCAPDSVTLGGEDVHAEVTAPEEGAWEVLVMINRPSDRALVDAEDLEVRSWDAAGDELEVVATPRPGPLTQAGGSLGMTASARFRFADSGEPLRRVEVGYRGGNASFTVGHQRPEDAEP